MSLQPRTIPVQLGTGPDGQPQVSIGGRVLTVTAEGVQLPMELFFPPKEADSSARYNTLAS